MFEDRAADLERTDESVWQAQVSPFTKELQEIHGSQMKAFDKELSKKGVIPPAEAFIDLEAITPAKPSAKALERKDKATEEGREASTPATYKAEKACEGFPKERSREGHTPREKEAPREGHSPKSASEPAIKELEKKSNYKNDQNHRNDKNHQDDKNCTKDGVPRI